MTKIKGMAFKLKFAQQSRCPFCTSEQTRYGEIQVDSGFISQEANCHDCDKEWYEKYELYEIVDKE